ncbi:MAG: Holliday junction resolvase RuvX [Clostridia bacterium]|nr:Holliday junction resolvase RuvX [Clostridia bacterium]
MGPPRRRRRGGGSHAVSGKRILGVDYGAVRTGIAATDAEGIAAFGVGTFKAKGLHELAGIIVREAAERDCSAIVIGLPVNMDGTEGEKCEKVRLLGQCVSELTDIPVEFYDERLTTVVAHQYLSATNVRGKKRKDTVDTLAAEIILQNYLDSKK